MPFLVDTNVISETMRDRPIRSVEAWLLRQARVFVSAVSIEELEFGLTRVSSLRLRSEVDRFVAERAEILAVTPPIARRAGQLRGEMARAGRVREPADMIIAATAELHGLTIATRNIRHFEGLGLAIVNPFS